MPNEAMSENPNTQSGAERLAKPTLWKRLTAFLFEHRWDVVGARIIEPYTPCTSLRCKRCGETVEYATFDREAFRAIYRSKGCTRHLALLGASNAK